MTIVRRMRAKYGWAEVDDCRESTGIRADAQKNIVVFKGEFLVPEYNAPKMCDCVIFHDDMKVVIAELKSKSPGRSSLFEKFFNTGEKFCEMIMPLNPNKFKIYLVLVAKKHKTSTIRMCTSNPVRIGGKSYKILPKINNVCLSEILRS